MLSSLLPAPKHCTHTTIKVVLPHTKKVSTALIVPASPDALVLDSGSSSVSQPPQNSTVAPIHLDETGSVDFAKTIAKASAHGDVQTSYEDTIPLKVRFPNLRHHFPRYTLATCPDDSLARCVEETKTVIDGLLFKAEGGEVASSEASYVKFTPSTLSATEDEASRGRTLEIRNYKEDPMLPPKFKLRKNREKEPSPPPPILKTAPTEKITKDIKDKWHIPSAVSNWKNNQGFAISLDKRVHAASGGSVDQGPSINIEKFSSLSSALENADRAARDELSARNEQRKQLALREQAEKEKRLQELLAKSRRQNGKRPGEGYHQDSDQSRKKYRGA
ncbi:hypothetical protein JCM33374_g5914 [Metschnikowia sp. JCM 33374]|nr:hypothetical protein JCM33374_g5914 [Metschnikowia sp. JCM 33374]